MGVGFVEISEIRAMLNECAPGYEFTAKLHHYWVTYQGRTFRALPLGDHSSRSKKKSGSADVKGSYVGQLMRALQLPEQCVRRHFSFI